MLVFHTVADLQAFLLEKKGDIGFVPTMGALHQGHLSLIKRAKEENDLVICSIFVNPTQFNDKKDLENYPRTEQRDLELLATAGCDAAFTPSIKEIYPIEDNSVFEFGSLDKVMEGSFRPGHFNGVALVVKRLFEIVKPKRAYFGQKDFQQLAIIRQLKEKLNLPVEIIGCPTVRESDGLAMSSRNMRLTEEERKSAASIPKVLFNAKKLYKEMSVSEIKQWAMEQLAKQPLLTPEYFEIVDSSSLQPIKSWSDTKECVACVAVKAGAVRLIDNMVLFP